MKKYLLLLTGCVLTATAINAQDLLGLGTGNYTGITGMSLNPASIVDSRLKFDINLIGVSNYYSNNYLSIKRDALIKGSFFDDKYKDWSLVQRDLLEENRLSPGERVRFRLNNRVIAPVSFMLTTGKKSAIALSIANRTTLTLDNLNQDFARLAYGSFNDSTMYNRAMDLSGINMNVLNWIDIGFTYGRVLLDKDKHFLKAAFTGKYIGGVASGYFQADNLTVSFTDKNTINANTPYAQYGHGNKLGVDMFKSASLRSLRPEAEGFGWNVGVMYEYRGKIDKFKYLTPESEEKVRRDVNKYAFRIGFAIMDAGRLSFKKSNLNNDFSASINDWYLKDYKIKSINDIDTALSQKVDYITPGKESYSVALPTAYSAQIDVHLYKGFYLNAMTYQPFNLMKADRRMRVEGAYAITPRFESRVFGVYMPVTYNKFDEWNMGATIRVGPVYFGSANLGSLLFNSKTKTADIHAGLRIPITYGSPSRVAKFFDKVTKKKDTAVVINTMPVKADSSKAIVIVKDTVLLQKEAELEALKARIYALEKQRIIDSVKLAYPYQQEGVQQPVSIVINNFAGAGAPSVKIDTVLKAKPNTVKKKAAVRDTLVVKNDTALIQQREAYQQYIRDLNKEKNAQIDTLLRILAEKELQLKELRRKQEMQKDSSIRLRDTLQKKPLAPEITEERKKPDSDTGAVSARLTDTLLSKEAAPVQPLPYSAIDDSNYTALQNEIASLKKTIYAYDTTVAAAKKSAETGTKKLEDEISRLRDDIKRYNEEDLTSNNIKREQELESLRTQLRSSGQQSADNADDDEQLKNEIARLREELKLYNNRTAPVVIKPGSDKIVYAQPSPNLAQLLTPAAIVATAGKPSKAAQPVIIRDTVYIKDTITKITPEVRVDTVLVKDTTILKDTTVVKDTVVVQKEIAKITTVDRTRDNLLSMQLEKILFRINQVTIQPSYRETLDFVAGKLKRYPSLALQIDGYTDKTGTPAINEALSMRRANAVKKYLLNRNVNESQLVVYQHGASEPVADNTTVTGQALNRRVELKFISRVE